MGLYDSINGFQLKSFYSFIYSSDISQTLGTNMWRSGGSLNNFKDGDLVPSKTLYYNYGDNYIIFDEFEHVAHQIKNSKVFKTFVKNEIYNLKKNDFNDKIINYQGFALNIKDANDLFKYSSALNKNKLKLKNIYKESSIWLDKLTTCGQILSNLNGGPCMVSSKETIITPEFIDKNKDLSLSTNIKYLVDEIKDNEELLKRVKIYYKNRFNYLNEQYESKRKLEMVYGNEIQNAFKLKWYEFDKTYNNVSELGSFIEIMLFSLQNVKDKVVFKNDLREMLLKENDLLNKYFDIFNIEIQLREVILKDLLSLYNVINIDELTFLNSNSLY